MFQTIVLAYDGSAECRDALADGIALATRFNARCHLLAVLPPMNSMAIASGYMPEGLLDKLPSIETLEQELNWSQDD